MQTPHDPERPSRYYHLFLQEDLLEGWNLVREWGFQGASGTMQREHFVDKEQAVEALLKVRDQQIKRGYLVMFMRGEDAPQ